jgi:RNA polymerase sigma factor (sigma-70 family)
MAFSPVSRRDFDSYLKPISPALLRLAAHRVGWGMAEDVLQDALLCGWQAISRFNPDTGSAGLARFLRPYVRDACKDFLRRALRPGEVLLPPEDILKAAECGVAPDISSLAYEALREQLYDLLSRISLTHLQEQCMRLWLEGLTQSQTAHYLQISQQMVSQHVQAGAAKLRDAWEWEQGQIEPGVLHFFWECVESQTAAVYHRPSGVWDRNYVTVEDRTRKARLFSLQDERERFKYRSGGGA